MSFKIFDLHTRRLEIVNVYYPGKELGDNWPATRAFHSVSERDQNNNPITSALLSPPFYKRRNWGRVFQELAQFHTFKWMPKHVLNKESNRSMWENIQEGVWNILWSSQGVIWIQIHIFHKNSLCYYSRWETSLVCI